MLVIGELQPDVMLSHDKSGTVSQGIPYKGIREQRYAKQGIRKQGIRSKVYLTTQPNWGRNTPLEFLTGT